MKVMNALIAMAILFIAGIWVQESTAEIDPDTLMGMWLFDQGKGDVVKDSSPNGNDGEIVDAKRVEGKEGMGIEFDGASHVVIPASKTTDGLPRRIYVSALGKTAS